MIQESDDSDLENAWQVGCSAIIPEKSKERYEKTFKLFAAWCNKKNLENITEKVMLAYFVSRNETLKSPGSLWAEYSMLKATIFLHKAVDISKYATLIAFLKRKNIGHKVKKSRIFTREHMYKFLNNFSDEVYLNIKVGMIFGIAGACRREELYNMKINDIEDKGAFIIVNIPDTKTHISRTFTITNQGNETVNYLEFYKKYLALRPKQAKSAHLFLAMRDGKVTNQVVGRNTIGSWPSKIAQCLKLPDPSTYTGHAFRRSSATILANQGIDILGLKRHGGWRSSSVAEGYIEDSVENKNQFSNKILHGNSRGNSTVTESDIAAQSVITKCAATIASSEENVVLNPNSIAPINFNNCSNCNFNFVFNKN